jgi:hypothetical protein
MRTRNRVIVLVRQATLGCRMGSLESIPWLHNMKKEDNFFGSKRRKMNIFVPQLSRERRKKNLFVPKLSKEQRQPKVSRERRKTNAFVPQVSKE